ncbi:MAG: RDD family protein [Mogibacterium sp.]|nr:RDD family protein [Mogibacterium sp.]
MEKKVMKLASSGKRLGAYLIDRVAPFTLFMVSAGSIAVLSYMPYNFGFGNGFGNGYGGFGGRYSNVGTVMTLLICMLIYVAYFVVQLIFYSKSKTIGKAILGMQVISSKNGEPVDFWVMLLREWFAKKASSAVFFLGFIWVLIDDRNRGWHDKIMDTYVIDLKETENLRKSSAPAAAKTAPVTVVEEPQSVAEIVVEEPQSVAETVVEEPQNVAEIVVEEPQSVAEAVVEEPQSVAETVVEEPQSVAEAVVEEPQNVADAAVEQPQNIEVETVVAEEAENEEFIGE